MNNDTTPPARVAADSLPDYYLGFLIIFDEYSEDACKWVVYDGTSRVRCPTRASAVDYITDRYNARRGAGIQSQLIDARISLNHAITQLDAAAHACGGVDMLQLQRLAVRIKPVLVEIDNIILL